MYSCVLIDIVPVSSEQPVEADQEQAFEEEPQRLSKEGKWPSPLHDSILSYVIALQLSLYLFYYCMKLTGTPFLRIYLDFLSIILGTTLFYKCFG
jgi:hypothetical protein